MWRRQRTHEERWQRKEALLTWSALLLSAQPLGQAPLLVVVGEKLRHAPLARECHVRRSSAAAAAAASCAQKDLTQTGASPHRCLDPADLRRHVVQGSEVLVGDDGQPQPDGDKVVDL